MEELDSIKSHWKAWANEFGKDLRATTRSSNIKKLEINALISMLTKHSSKSLDELNVLEVGCGNGFNAISISEALKCRVDAFDFIHEMVESAKSNLEQCPIEIKNLINFFEGDVLNIDKSKKYDFVLSCRCLINLPNWDMQKTAIKELMSITSKNGALLLLENFNDSHSRQNNLRDKVGLKIRKVAEFNHFFNQSDFLELLEDEGYILKDESSFSSLHDIIQYVIVPMINNGEVDYKHEVVGAITDLMLKMDFEDQSLFGNFGQNKLLVLSHE